MATKKMSNIKLLQTLRGFDKPYFSVADLEKILGMEKKTLYVTLNRLVKSGVLSRLKRGVYIPEFQTLVPEKIANELYYPSYLSFEAALSKYGILSQTPYVLTFATTKKSKKLRLADIEVEYRQLKRAYFFGYKLKDSLFIAEPEKAMLDQLYMMSKGKSESDTGEWSLVGLNKSKFLRYGRSFPRIVQNKAKELASKFGKHTVTINQY